MMDSIETIKKMWLMDFDNKISLLYEALLLWQKLPDNFKTEIYQDYNVFLADFTGKLEILMANLALNQLELKDLSSAVDELSILQSDMFEVMQIDISQGINDIKEILAMIDEKIQK